MSYALALLVSFGISLGLTPLLRRVATRHGIFAQTPDIKAHAIDARIVPYLGGLAVWASFTAVTMAFVPMSRPLAALLLGGTILAVVGAVDDVRGLSPYLRLGLQFLAALIVLAGGIGIVTVTNPFGG